jgi:hypothetical protein
MLNTHPPAATAAPHGGRTGSEHRHPPADTVAPHGGLSCSEHRHLPVATVAPYRRRSGSEHHKKKRREVSGKSLSTPAKKSRGGDESVE